MNQIFHTLLKRRVIFLINDLSANVSELIIDIDLSIGTINSIEIDKDEIFLHIFKEDFDFGFYFDDLSEIDKLKVFKVLKTI
jgi:hypothetical protein